MPISLADNREDVRSPARTRARARSALCSGERGATFGRCSARVERIIWQLDCARPDSEGSDEHSRVAIWLGNSHIARNRCDHSRRAALELRCSGGRRVDRAGGRFQARDRSTGLSVLCLMLSSSARSSLATASASTSHSRSRIRVRSRVRVWNQSGSDTQATCAPPTATPSSLAVTGFVLASTASTRAANQLLRHRADLGAVASSTTSLLADGYSSVAVRRRVGYGSIWTARSCARGSLPHCALERVFHVRRVCKRDDSPDREQQRERSRDLDRETHRGAFARRASDRSRSGPRASSSWPRCT